MNDIIPAKNDHIEINFESFYWKYILRFNQY